VANDVPASVVMAALARVLKSDEPKSLRRDPQRPDCRVGRLGRRLPHSRYGDFAIFKVQQGSDDPEAACAGLLDESWSLP
jgi:hypothetical protein